MAHFTTERPNLGAWAIASTVQPGEFWNIDTKIAKSINGDDGGTWAPLTVITIGGAGLAVTGGFTSVGATVSGTFASTGHAQFDSAAFSDAVNFSEGFTVGSGNVVFDGGTVTFAPTSGAVTFGPPVNFDAAVDFDDSAVFSDDATFNDTVSINGLLQANSFVVFAVGASVNGAVTLTGSGHVRERTAIGANTNSTYGVDTADLVYVPANSLTADCTYLISNTGAGNGSSIRVYIAPNSNTVTVRRAVDNSLLGDIRNNVTGDTVFLDLKMVAGVWQIVGFSKL